MDSETAQTSDASSVIERAPQGFMLLRAVRRWRLRLLDLFVRRVKTALVAGALFIGAGAILAPTAEAATITVGPGCALDDAIRAANTDTAVNGCAAGSGADTIILPAATITIGVDFPKNPAGNGLPIITSDIAFEGASTASTIIDGNGLYRPFFIGRDTAPNPTVSFANLTIRNSLAKGGDSTRGGGAGAGLGGAMFVYGGNVTIRNVGFADNQARGGTSSGNSWGPGGGMEGDAGAFDRDAMAGLGGGGAVGRHDGGGYGNSGGKFNGGGPDFNDGGWGGGGGGHNYQGDYCCNLGGGDGGFGGGGGSGAWTGGSAGFGGGAGGGGSSYGSGSAGFGGGGAGAAYFAGDGGYGGGDGADGYYGSGGGGGAGFGGAVFAKSGSLTFDAVTFVNNSADGGAGGDGAGDGAGLGGAVFICSVGLDDDCNAEVAECASTTFDDNTAASGNADTFGSATCLADSTPPIASPTFPYAEPNEAGWHTGRAATVSWNWSDGGSGLDLSRCEESSRATQEGTTVLTGSCTDLARNVGIAEITVRIDRSDPRLTLRSGPPIITTEPSATFAFRGSDVISGVSGYFCSLTAGPLPDYEECTSPVTYDGLIDDKAYTFNVQVRDVAGRTRTMAWAFSVDLEYEPPSGRMCQGLPVTIDMNTNGGDGTGTMGRDVIVGTRGDDLIQSFSGDDVICAGDGNDRIEGGAGHDRIDGGRGDDTIEAGSGDDVIAGRAGDDTIHGGQGDDEILGQAGDDIIDGSTGSDHIESHSGNDIVYGGAHNDVILTGDGEDEIDAGGGDDRVKGGEGNDTIFGGNGNDKIWGRGGNDTIDGGDGADTLVGGSGADIIDGGVGNDILRGKAGDDKLSGGADADHLNGGGDNDSCNGNRGTDTSTSCETISSVP